MQIAEQTVVTIHYTLTDAKGEVLDSSDEPTGGEPLSYIQGTGMIVPGLENALVGKQAGDQVKVTVDPEGGYGPRREGLVQKVPRKELPDGDIEVGMRFRAHGPAGSHVLTVAAVDEESVTLDGNHPLAGATLNFAVKVVSVREATEEDLHPHGGHECSGCHGCGEH